MASGTRYQFTAQAQTPDAAAKVLAEVTSDTAVKTTSGENFDNFNVEFVSFDLTVPDDWIPAELETDWSNASGTTRFRRLDDGRVEIQIAVSGVAPNTTIFTLPDTMRPAQLVTMMVCSSVGVIDVKIQDDGQVIHGSATPGSATDCYGVCTFTSKYGVDEPTRQGLPISIPIEMKERPKAVLVSNGLFGLKWDYQAGEIVVKNIMGLPRQVKTTVELWVIGG